MTRHLILLALAVNLAIAGTHAWAQQTTKLPIVGYLALTASFVELLGDTEGTKSQTGTLMVELSTDDPESFGSLTVQSHANAYALAVRIPEPGIAWLLLAGLGAAGWAVRRGRLTVQRSFSTANTE